MSAKVILNFHQRFSSEAFFKTPYLRAVHGLVNELVAGVDISQRWGFSLVCGIYPADDVDMEKVEALVAQGGHAFHMDQCDYTLVGIMFPPDACVEAFDESLEFDDPAAVVSHPEEYGYGTPFSLAVVVEPEGVGGRG